MDDPYGTNGWEYVGGGTGGNNTSRIEEIKEMGASASFSDYEARMKIKKLEDLICDICSLLDQKELDFDLTPQLNEWWLKHKEETENRLEIEKQKLTEERDRAALYRRLSEYELKLLGIKKET